MTVPSINLISKGVRNLMNVRFYAMGYKGNDTLFRSGVVLEYNDDLDKMYRKRLFVRRKGGGLFCQGLKLPKANEELLKEYEKRKELFKLSIYSDIERKLVVYERKEKEKMADTTVLLGPQQRYYDLRWGGRSRKEVTNLLVISKRQGYDLEKKCREQGKTFPEEQKINEKIAKLPDMRGASPV